MITFESISVNDYEKLGVWLDYIQEETKAKAIDLVSFLSEFCSVTDKFFTELQRLVIPDIYLHYYRLFYGNYEYVRFSFGIVIKCFVGNNINSHKRIGLCYVGDLTHHVEEVLKNTVEFLSFHKYMLYSKQLIKRLLEIIESW